MPPGGMMPGMSGMGGMNSPYGKGGPIQKKMAKDRDPKSSEAADAERLPPGYHVPPEPPEALTTADEWTVDPFGKKKPNTVIGEYKTILAAGVFASDEQKKFVADIMRWRLSLLTRKEFREQAAKYRGYILQDISNFPTNKGAPRDVRKHLLKTIAEEAPKLFKYHAIARINGAILLAELSDPAYNEADGDNRKPAEPCIRALDPLTNLVKDKDQLTAPRIWGVNGLVRLPRSRSSSRSLVLISSMSWSSC
jgi:hypothetical protein